MKEKADFDLVHQPMAMEWEVQRDIRLGCAQYGLGSCSDHQRYAWRRGSWPRVAQILGGLDTESMTSLAMF